MKTEKAWRRLRALEKHKVLRLEGFLNKKHHTKLCSNFSLSDTAPKTPPCIVTILIAAS